MDARDFALGLCARGVPVFPCNEDKSPLTPNGFKDASVNAETITDWWARWPTALIGVPTGRISGLVVVDVDPDGVPWAIQNWNDLKPQYVHVTRRNGRHLFYQYPAAAEIKNSTSKLSLGVDVRGLGGYIIWWPANGHEIQGSEIGPLPDWLMNRLVPVESTNRQQFPISSTGAIIGEGLRNDFLSREAYRLRKQGSEIAQTLEVLRALNSARCDPPLDDAEVIQIARGKARISPDPTAMIVGFGHAPLPQGALPIGNAANTNVGEVELLCASSITPEAIRWLWPLWLALGKLTILAGNGGTGKSTVAFNLAAVVTTGGIWPDGTRCEGARNVLIWSAEDDPADTIIPRLMAAGADLGRVHFVKGRRSNDGQPVPFDPAHDMPFLQDAIARLGGASLLIVDPIVCAVAGDMHKANDVRRGLQSLVDLAAKFDCAVVGITHFSKGSKGSSPQERVLGSQAFGALARMVLVCAKDEESETRVFARAKSNISADTGGISYQILTTTLSNEIIATFVKWGNRIEGSARAILGEMETEAEGDSQHSECAQSMVAIIRDPEGHPVEMPSAEVKAKLKSEGYSPKMIRTARKKLRVQIRRSGNGSDMKSYWRLPTDEDIRAPQFDTCPSTGEGTNEI